MAFKGGVVLGTVNLNATGTANTSLGATSNSGTVAIGNASSTAVNVLGPTNVNVAGAANTAIGSTSNTGTVAIGNTNSTSVTVVGPVNINTSSTNNTAIGSTSNSGTISIGNTSSGLVSIGCGTAGINVGTTANAHATTVGSTTASATTIIQAPSGGVTLTGVQGVAVANKNYVTINTSTGAIGSDAGTSASISITGDSGGALTGTSFTFTGASTGLTFAGAGSTETLGGTLAIANGGTDATSFTQSNGIVTYNGTRLVNYAGPQINSSGIATNTTQPCFLYTNNADQASVTGDGTIYNVVFSNKIFDNDNNFDGTSTFTAPVTGNYSFQFNLYLENISTAMTNCLIYLTTTGASYRFMQESFAPAQFVSGGIYLITYSLIAPMSATDTAVLTIRFLNGSKAVTIVGATNAGFTSPIFSGYLIC